MLRPVSTQPRAHSAHGDLLFTYFILRNLSNRQRSKCVRLVVELKSTPALDILVAPIRFVVDVNKLYFPGKKVMLLCEGEGKRSPQWKLNGEHYSAQRRLLFRKQ